jgi:hypothetical protein
MREHISLGGVPVVGFGADPYEMALAQERAAAPATIICFLLGAVGGAVLGNVIHKGAVGTAIGTVVGGIGGGIGGNLLASSFESSARAYRQASWRRIPVTEIANLKSGQQLAIAAGAPYRTPIPPEDIAAINLQFEALKTAPVNLPFKNFATYPPGSKLPDDWPTDDDLGPNAYRISEELIMDAPPEAARIEDLAPKNGTIEVWVRP